MERRHRKRGERACHEGGARGAPAFEGHRVIRGSGGRRRRRRPDTQAADAPGIDIENLELHT